MSIFKFQAIFLCVYEHSTSSANDFKLFFWDLNIGAVTGAEPFVVDI